MIKVGTISTKDIRIQMPLIQTVKWNPSEYEIKHIDTERGIIKLKRIEDK